MGEIIDGVSSAGVARGDGYGVDVIFRSSGDQLSEPILNSNVWA